MSFFLGDEEPEAAYQIEFTITNVTANVTSGVQGGEGEQIASGCGITLAYPTIILLGDGTVPLMSLGYMCVEGWTNKKYPFNPAGIEVSDERWIGWSSILTSYDRL